MNNKTIPYKIYLEEHEMPRQWYNVRADMKRKPAPLLNPVTLQPSTLDELSKVFCRELAKQELDDTTAYFDIPEEIWNFYRMYRPAPLIRAYCLEEKLQTPAHIYYKFEGNNTSGSHKLNSAIAQAYYAKKEGLKGVTTETGAGQWGTALSMACSYLDLDCQVYMVKCSYEQKPFRREVMRTYGAQVTPSPSMTTEVGRKINEEFPGTTGSLGCAISEAVEAATRLIIFTNDGDFAATLSHPSAELEKEYIVETSQNIPAEFPENFKRGIRTNGVFYKCRDAQILKDRKIRIVLIEGKNREIRNVLDSINIGTKSLTRVRIGNVSIQDMKPGEFRDLSQNEVSELLSLTTKQKEVY